MGRWLRNRAENVAVLLIATMFVCFLMQIVFRYFLNQPLGWTEEVTVLCWLWVVLWCAAFVLRDEEEVRFDIVYGAVSVRTRRVFNIITSIALIALLAISLPATVKYVLFMKREHSAYLRIPFVYLYSIYVIFAVACIIRHARLLWRAFRGEDAGEGVMPAEQGAASGGRAL
jgi:TRAP-type C4-dicarboxylate transport system permease small subunit